MDEVQQCASPEMSEPVRSRSPIAQIGQSVSVIGGRGANGRASALAGK